MEKDKSIYSKISKTGPLFKIEGGFIFLHPFKSIPLRGFNENEVLEDEKSFIQSIISLSTDWFIKFPDCCDTHSQLKEIGDFDKNKFSFIPEQIVNNVKYAAFAIEEFIDTDNGLNEIKDYIDYLIESFGKPAIDGHIFERALIGLIEGLELKDKEFTDDQRLELLEHLEPQIPPIDLEERDLSILYTTFQKWLKAMPNIGRFKKLKEQLTGKVPINIFMIEPKFNKYLGTSNFKSRSPKELLKFLFKMTNDILILSRQEISRENYDKEKFIIAGEERLKIKQDKLLDKSQSDLELSYLDLIEDWLSMVIEFYQVLNQAIEEGKSQKIIIGIEDINKNTHDILNSLEQLQIEISALGSSNKILNWMKIFLPNDTFKKLLEEIEKLDANDKESSEILDKMISQMQISGLREYKFQHLKKKTDNPDISIKHKLKLTIPLFLFTKYEAEIELSDKQKIPNSIKELKELFLK